MLSRVADSIFWMSRYAERTNSMLRLIRTNYISSQDELKDFSWKSLLKVFSDLEDDAIEPIAKNSQKVLECLVLDRQNPFSVINTVTSIRENARAVQDHITKEVWQCLNEFYHMMRDPKIERMLRSGDPVSALDILMREGLLYYGVVDSTMVRGEGYNFLNIGKFLERGLNTNDIVKVKLEEDELNGGDKESPLWRYLLYSLSGYELYIKKNKGEINSETVLQQVIYNESFAHSLMYSLCQVNRYIERLKNDSLPGSYKQMEYTIGRVMNSVKYSNINMEDKESVRNFLLQNKQEFYSLAQTLNNNYFGNNN